MIKALIQNGDDRVLLLNFPSTQMKLAGSLTYLGINKPASEISCLADEKNSMSVKLFGNDAIDKKSYQQLNPTHQSQRSIPPATSSTLFHSLLVLISLMRFTNMGLFHFMTC